jgi:hypothetical protein
MLLLLPLVLGLLLLGVVPHGLQGCMGRVRRRKMI